MKYKAYNKLYVNGKPTGRRYITATGSTASRLKEKVTKENAAWNKKVGKKQNVKVKLVEIKKQIKR
jgi:hypothetical protein